MGTIQKFPINRGVYILWLYLPAEATITIGRLGSHLLKKGVYAYVGSAQRNLEQRLARHARLEKKLHWHIDYVRAKAKYLGAVCFYGQPKQGECWLTGELLKIPGSYFPIAGLGSSDCQCTSHFVKIPLANPRSCN